MSVSLMYEDQIVYTSTVIKSAILFPSNIESLLFQLFAWGCGG